tara:strand:- start:633 stop:779 length:147 start_codon:yes stop_codon:yes gene_type:complete
MKKKAKAWALIALVYAVRPAAYVAGIAGKAVGYAQGLKAKKNGRHGRP